MKSKDRGTNRKKQKEALKKEALRAKDAAFFAAVKYTLLAFGLMFLSFTLLYIGQEYSPGVFLLSTERTSVSFLPCVGVWLSARYIKKTHDTIQPNHILLRYFSMAFYIGIQAIAVLLVTMWVLEFLLSL